MKFGAVNESTTVNRFVLHTLQRNITHLAVITCKTNIKLGILKGGGGDWKRARAFFPFPLTCKFLQISLLTALSDCSEN